MHRRTLLGLGAGLLAGSALAGWAVARSGQQPLLLSARDDGQGGHLAVGYRLDGHCQFSTPVRERCHDIHAHPALPLALFVGRRPSRESYLIDTRDGRLLQTLHSPADRHFYGHAIFDRRGELLYSTENDTRDPGRGVIGVWRLQGQRLERAGEFASQGIGPHQLLWLPGGEQMVVANGGIRTEADSRASMNLDRMQPSLVILDRQGRLLDRDELAQRQCSIRHLAVAADGTIACGQQYEGNPEDVAPLVAIKRPGQPLQPFALGETQRQGMRQYTASVAIHSQLRLLAITAPRGNRFFIWDLDTAVLKLDAPLPDCAGVGAVEQGFVVSSGQGRCRLYDCRSGEPQFSALELPPGLWDNHLRLA